MNPPLGMVLAEVLTPHLLHGWLLRQPPDRLFCKGENYDEDDPIETYLEEACGGHWLLGWESIGRFVDGWPETEWVASPRWYRDVQEALMMAIPDGDGLRAEDALYAMEGALAFLHWEVGL